MKLERYDQSRIARTIGLSQGKPLAASLRIALETNFGHDFSEVRVHTYARAAEAARSFGAKAFSVGSHVAFASGCYAPESREGLWLLAHELSHVIQQRREGWNAPLTDPVERDALESAADRAADIIVSGRTVPKGFSFGSAPYGTIQLHVGPACTGFAIISDPATVALAERRIERAYRERQLAFGDVMYASNNFQATNEYGAVDAFPQFLNELRRMIWQRPPANRPNIVNIHEREVYFFRRQFQAQPAEIKTIGLFHRDLDRLLRKHKMATWASTDSNWFPDHALALAGDPQRRFVCTQATNHQPPRGLILYDIRGPRRQRRAERRATSYELWTADVAMAEFFPSLKAELGRAVRTYDSQNSNFVFLVPAAFYYEYRKQKVNNKIWNSFRVAPSYDFPGGQAVKELQSRIHHVSKILSIAGMAVIVVGSIVFFVAAAAAAATAGAVATTGATAGAAAAASLPATTTVIAPAGVIVQTWAVGSTAAATVASTGGATAALWAAAAAPAAKTIVASAGVLLLIGTVKNAHAGTNLPDKPLATQVSAFRAVPVADFKPIGAMQTASGQGPPEDFFHTPDTARGKFNVGTKVLFDNVPHIIIGGFSAK
jgi:hypothetical protein